jgi:alpha-beta hydrolase superfamily lysophospholipase
MAEGGRHVLSKAPAWCVPTLLLWAGEDKLVNPAGSAALAAQAPRSGAVPVLRDGLSRDLQQSPELAAPVFARLEQWLDQRFPAA